MKLIVGLGNPGKEYQFTRHNAGFLTITELAQKHNIELRTQSCKAICGKGRICNENVILALPQTYMNESGVSIKQLLSYYNITIEDLIIIYDDMDTDVGSIRIRTSGSAGTHNGMKSVIYHIGTDKFDRIRIGIGRPENKNIVDFVLGEFPLSEHEALKNSIDDACNAINIMLTRGTDIAMNMFNKKKKAE